MEKGPAFHQAAVQVTLSVQFTQQVQKIPRHLFAKHIVIDGAKRPPDRPGAVLASFPVGACRFGRTTATAGFCAPTQTLVPLERKHLRRILSELSRGAQPTATPEVLGEANAPIGLLRRSSIDQRETVPNCERKPNRLCFVPLLANLGRRSSRCVNGAV